MKGERKQFSPVSLKATMDAGRRRRTVLKKISVSDSQLVGKVGKRRMTFLWRRVSAPGGAARGDGVSSASVTAFLLDKEAVGHLPGGLPFAQSPFIFVPICHLLLHPPHLCMQCQPTPPPSTSPRSLSAAVKSDRLQVCFLSEGRFTAAVRPQAPLYDIAPLPIY